MEPQPEPPVAQGDVGSIGPRTYVVADVQPLDVDGLRTVAVGAGLWLAAFLLLLPFRGWLADTDRLWWLWSCLVGFGLGVVGWAYCWRRKQRRERSRRA